MRCLLLTGFLATVLAAPAAGQITIEPQPAPPRPAAAGQPGPTILRGDEKLEYIGRRLDLNQEQKQLFDGLLEVYRATMEQERGDAAQILQHIRALMDDMKKAQDAGDKAKADAIKEMINQLRPGVRAEREFYDGLMPRLTEDQKSMLAVLRSRLDKGPVSESLTPMDVLKIARAQSLSADQSTQLARIEGDFRTKMNEPRPADEKARGELLEQLIRDVRAILTPEQAAQFDKQVKVLRPDPPKKPDTPAVTPGGSPGQLVPAAPPKPAETPPRQPGGTPPAKPADPQPPPGEKKPG